MRSRCILAIIGATGRAMAQPDDQHPKHNPDGEAQPLPRSQTSDRNLGPVRQAQQPARGEDEAEPDGGAQERFVDSSRVGMTQLAIDLGQFFPGARLVGQVLDSLVELWQALDSVKHQLRHGIRPHSNSLFAIGAATRFKDAWRIWGSSCSKRTTRSSIASLPGWPMRALGCELLARRTLIFLHHLLGDPVHNGIL